MSHFVEARVQLSQSWYLTRIRPHSAAEPPLEHSSSLMASHPPSDTPANTSIRHCILGNDRLLQGYVVGPVCRHTVSMAGKVHEFKYSIQVFFQYYTVTAMQNDKRRIPMANEPPRSLNKVSLRQRHPFHSSLSISMAFARLCATTVRRRLCAADSRPPTVACYGTVIHTDGWFLVKFAARAAHMLAARGLGRSS